MEILLAQHPRCWDYKNTYHFFLITTLRILFWSFLKIYSGHCCHWLLSVTTTHCRTALMPALRCDLAPTEPDVFLCLLPCPSYYRSLLLTHQVFSWLYGSYLSGSASVYFRGPFLVPLFLSQDSHLKKILSWPPKGYSQVSWKHSFLVKWNPGVLDLFCYK